MSFTTAFRNLRSRQEFVSCVVLAWVYNFTAQWMNCHISSNSVNTNKNTEYNGIHICSLELSLRGMKVLGNFPSLELSFCGTFTPIMCISPFIEKRKIVGPFCVPFFLELSLSSFCSYCHVYAVGLYVKTQINNKHNNENRKIYRLLEQCLYHI